MIYKLLCLKYLIIKNNPIISINIEEKVYKLNEELQYKYKYIQQVLIEQQNNSESVYFQSPLRPLPAKKINIWLYHYL